MRLSLVIPTLNEAERIGQTLKAVLERGAPHEVIVVDAGSQDATQAVVSRFPGVQFHRQPQLKGRKYASLNYGAAQATGDALLFLDADSLPPKGYDRAIEKALNRPRCVGGSFELWFDKLTPLVWLVQTTNQVRYRLHRRYYGDQGLFVRLKTFQAVGGYPERLLLESDYLCRALSRHGKLTLIHKPMLTSSRRFIDNGTLRVFAHDIRIWAADLLGYDVERHASAYWQQNADRAQAVSSAGFSSEEPKRSNK